MHAQLTAFRAHQQIADRQRVADAEAVGRRRRGAASSVKPGPAHRPRQRIAIALALIATAAALALLAPGVAAAEPPSVSAPAAVSDPIVTSGMAYVDGGVTLSATLSGFGGGLPGRTVDFAVTDPSGDPVPVPPATTGDDGQASATFTPPQKGLYDVVASFGGDVADASSTSADLSIPVYQKVKLSVPHVNAVAGVPTNVSATLVTVPGGQPVPGQRVEFSSEGDPFPATPADSTDADGVASVFVEYPDPGSFTATASFSIPADYFANADGSLTEEFASGAVDVSPVVTSVSNPIVPDGVIVGDRVTLSATLTRVDGGGLSGGQRVDFVVTDPSGDLVTPAPSGMTGDDGTAFATFTPRQKGVYDVVASFKNDSLALASSSSGTVSFRVYQPTSLTMSSVSARCRGAYCGVGDPGDRSRRRSREGSERGVLAARRRPQRPQRLLECPHRREWRRQLHGYLQDHGSVHGDSVVR